MVCTRESTYLPHFDYTADGKFDNAPVAGTIDFSEDFYKPLGNPSPVTKYTVTYDSNGGNLTPPSQTVAEGCECVSS